MTLKQYTISHDRNKCIGCGSCEIEAPQTWTLQTEDGLSSLKNGTKKNGTYVAVIDEYDYEANNRACTSCPVHAIKIDPKN